MIETINSFMLLLGWIFAVLMGGGVLALVIAQTSGDTPQTKTDFRLDRQSAVSGYLRFGGGPTFEAHDAAVKREISAAMKSVYGAGPYNRQGIEFTGTQYADVAFALVSDTAQDAKRLMGMKRAAMAEAANRG